MRTKDTVYQIVAIGLAGLLLLGVIYLASLKFQPHTTRTTEVNPMQRKFTMAFHITGTLSANATFTFTVPSDCQLVHVSAVASNDSDATLIVGTSADDNGYITSFTIGDSGTPVEKEALTDFDGALASNQFPHIVDGTIVVATLDYDGSSGTAAQNVTLVLTFVEG
jgi:hypothetical protein